MSPARLSSPHSAGFWPLRASVKFCFACGGHEGVRSQCPAAVCYLPMERRAGVVAAFRRRYSCCSITVAAAACSELGSGAPCAVDVGEAHGIRSTQRRRRPQRRRWRRCRAVATSSRGKRQAAARTGNQGHGGARHSEEVRWARWALYRICCRLAQREGACRHAIFQGFCAFWCFNRPKIFRPRRGGMSQIRK